MDTVELQRFDENEKKKTEEQLLYNRERNVVNKLGHLDIPF